MNTDNNTSPADDLETSIGDLLEFNLEVVEIDGDESDLEAGCLSCS